MLAKPFRKLKMKKLLIGFFLLFSQLNIMAQKSESYIQYVNSLIGTRKMGHTFPGATVPFGSVQLSPDTDQQPHNISGKYNKDTYKYCAGYQYDDQTIVGFSHTHFSGTGHSDLGDFLIHINKLDYYFTVSIIVPLSND